MRRYALFLIVFLTTAVMGCVPKISLLPDYTGPLKEFTISGTGADKVLMIPIAGVLSDKRRGSVVEKPSIVQEVVAQLQLAEKDPRIKAVVLKINSPGGTVTASDILYHEIAAFKKRSGAKIVAAAMDLTASGGYYVALPADFIMAHPTSIVGSVGVIMIVPRVSGLMDKIGVSVSIYKYGEEKDMASPFRPATTEENRLLQDMTDQFGKRFVGLVETHRKLAPGAIKAIASARVFTGVEAKQVGMVDGVGFLSDALLEAKKLAGLPEDARVVVYRRNKYANDTIYNNATARSGNLNVSLVNLNLPAAVSSLDPGFYYLWLTGTGADSD